MVGILRRIALVLGFVSATITPALAQDTTFEAGSLIVPMDIDYQDDGMLEAFGLVYALLRADIEVFWVIDPNKVPGGVDFVASGTDVESDAPVVDHGYRGGPFVVAADQAADALALVQLWQDQHVTAVHEATAPFDGFVAKHLVAAPTIAVFADGNEHIAFGYLNAAAIPDSTGQAWPAKKEGDAIYPDHPDVLNVVEVAGPTDTDHSDGALFDGSGLPAYCQIMTMHWGVNDVVNEVVAEMRAFLQHPTHLFAECQAVNAIENSINGKFLTPNGFLIDDKPSEVEFGNASYPFAQMDGGWEIIGGSEPSYSLPEGDEYLDSDIVMITEAGTPPGVRDVWMTGFVDGTCQIGSEYGGAVIGTGNDFCPEGVGKVSYLGGHAYDTKLPISDNPKTQGTRLFLNSLFEADCATAEGQPLVTLTKSGPATSADGLVTWIVTVQNFGPGIAGDVTITDPLPAQTTYIESDPDGAYDGSAHTITWDVGTLGPGGFAQVTVTVSLDAEGTYENVATASWVVGVNDKSLTSAPAATVYSSDADGDGCPDTVELDQGTSTSVADTDEDGFDDCDDVCPTDPNPLQDLTSDPDNCGACGEACAGDQVVAAVCDAGDCVVQTCEAGWVDADNDFGNGCETPEASEDLGGSDVGPVDAGAEIVEDGGSTSDIGGSDASDGGSGSDVSDDAGPVEDGAGDGSSSGDGGGTVSDAVDDGDATAADVASDVSGGDGGGTFSDADEDAAVGDADEDGSGGDTTVGDAGGQDVSVDAGPGDDAASGDVTGGPDGQIDAGVLPDVGGGGSAGDQGCDCQAGQPGSAPAWPLAGLLLLWLLARARRRSGARR